VELMGKILYEELSYLTIGAALEVHRQLGPGFLESVYEQSLAHELVLRGIPFGRQVSLRVMYKGTRVGEYRADFVVDGRIVLEIKAASALNPTHEAQAHHYLAATGLRLAILFNFGTRSLQIKRVIRQVVGVIRVIRGQFYDLPASRN
jgi:GxxExxY protein